MVASRGWWGRAGPSDVRHPGKGTANDIGVEKVEKVDSTSVSNEPREQVDRIYKKAIELGGSDEGAPGLRAEGGDGFYAAYFRDLDGNKLDVFSYG